MIEILQSDRAFTDSPDIGHHRCLCSRCGERIRNSKEGAIRGWTGDKALEYRYHYRCLGIEESSDSDWIDDLPDEYEEDYPYPEIETCDNALLNLGTCCVCRRTIDVVNIVNLPYKTFIPGTGWGNVEYNLPADGAVAVVCNSCIEGFDLEDLVDVVYDYPSQKQRKSFSELTAKQQEFGLDAF